MLAPVPAEDLVPTAVPEGTPTGAPIAGKSMQWPTDFLYAVLLFAKLDTACDIDAGCM